MTDSAEAESSDRPDEAGPATATHSVNSSRRGRFADALRDPGLRRFSTGTLAWGMAHQMITASQGFVLLELTDDRIWLGWLSAAVGFPNIIAAVIGGVLSDRLQRRTLLMLGSSIVALPMLAIAVLYATDQLEPWHILVAGSAQGRLAGSRLDIPAVAASHGGSTPDHGQCIIDRPGGLQRCPCARAAGSRCRAGVASGFQAVPTA